MGADIKSLRSRIRSVDSTLHLTKAMGLVASSKIRRATLNMGRSREYTAAMAEVVDQLRSSPDCAKSPYMRPRGGGTRLIVIAGDRGLAGGYNANVFRLAATEPEAQIIPIGKRACDRYGKGYPSSERFTAEDARKIAEEQCGAFLAGEFGKLGILYTRYQSIMTQVAEIRWVLPLEADQAEKSVELDALIALMQSAPALQGEDCAAEKLGDVRIAVARDEAFCFAYEETLDRMRYGGESAAAQI